MSSSNTRFGRWGWLRARPRLLIAGGVVTVALVAFVLYWFQPQALLFDRVVDEEFPADTTGQQRDAGAADHREESEPVVADGPVALATGGFESRNRYTVTGTATVFELDDGSRTLRLEPFESTNGPDLFVYLAAADHGDEDSALSADHVNLGKLRGNVGNQNYDIPADVDLATYDTVVIWCERFSTGFGAADLAAKP